MTSTSSCLWLGKLLYTCWLKAEWDTTRTESLQALGKQQQMLPINNGDKQCAWAAAQACSEIF